MNSISLRTVFFICNVIYFIILFSLKLPVQSVLNTTVVVSSSVTCGRSVVYSGYSNHYVIFLPVATKSLKILQRPLCHLLPTSGEVYSIQHYVIKFVSDLRQVRGFLRVLGFLQ